MTLRSLLTICLVAVTAALAACSHTAPPAAPATVPAATPLAPDAESSDTAIRFLERKAKDDPLDFVVRNQLVGRYLQRLRETGNLDYLRLAAQAAKESLASVGPEGNVGGLAALAQVEFASHEFASARDHAKQLLEYDPGKLYPYILLGDAQLDLGEYEDAGSTFLEVERRGANTDGGTLNAETRLARLAMLKGSLDVAENHFARAVEIAQSFVPPPQETVAWCYWQLGETSFLAGDYAKAEQRYRDALTAFPDYYRALGSLARVEAARGDLQSAIENYERATRILPDPMFVAALGDCYKLAGRDADAETQYTLVEKIGQLSESNGALYNRQLALFRADHDRKTAEAYEAARREYEVRRDVYGADTVAWTALKAGKIDEAQQAMKDAMRLGTRDAKLLYHAGMIARAAGDTAEARKQLEAALALSPGFDPLQARVARQTLDGMQ